MKRISLIILVIPLMLFEVYLCATFLPDSWLRVISSHAPDILPKSNDWTPITHPLLSQEIEQVLREHIGIRLALYAVTAGLLLGNAWLIRLLWRLRGRAQTATRSKSW
jgi:hypothetical protein